MALRYNFAPTSRSERPLAWVFSFPLRCGVMVNSNCSMRCTRRQTQGTETEKEVKPTENKECFTRAEWAGEISWGKAAQRFPCFLFSQPLGEWEKNITHDSVCSNSAKQSADTLLTRTQWCANCSDQNTSSVWTCWPTNCAPIYPMTWRHCGEKKDCSYRRRE